MSARRRSRPRAHGERGSTTPLLLVLVVVVVLGVAGAARVGDAAVRRARADATADAVALAGAVAGAQRATDVARHNGADLVDLEARADGAVQVLVDRGGLGARAAARRVGLPVEPGG